MQDIRFGNTVLILANVLESRRGSVVSVGDYHPVLDQQSSYLKALAVRIFRPDARHLQVAQVKLQLLVHLISGKCIS